MIRERLYRTRRRPLYFTKVIKVLKLKRRIVELRLLLDFEQERVSKLESKITEHNEGCARLCEEERKCKTSICHEYRNNRCPECPRDWMIEE